MSNKEAGLNKLVKVPQTRVPHPDDENQGRGKVRQGIRVSNVIVAALLVTVISTSVATVVKHFSSSDKALATAPSI